MQHFKLKTRDDFDCPLTGIWMPESGPGDPRIVIKGTKFPPGDEPRTWLMLRRFS
ncbi:hypothetical protein ACS3SW_13250 [Roseobacteraceae bacterium S113]